MIGSGTLSTAPLRPLPPFNCLASTQVFSANQDRKNMKAMDGETKSNASLSVPGPSDSHSPNDTMNYSNASHDRLHDKVDRIHERPQDRDAQLEGDLKASSTKKPPTTQLVAASVLTSLKPDSSTGQNLESEEQEEESDFLIPLRLTKSGRKRATPFPMKVCDRKNSNTTRVTTGTISLILSFRSL
jgi:hypothetical protein